MMNFSNCKDCHVRIDTASQDEGQQVTLGLPKWGRTEAVFQLLFFNLASYPA